MPNTEHRPGRWREPPSPHRACRSAITGLAVLAACQLPDPTPPVLVQIPEGAPVEAVAESLAAHGVIRSARRFTRLARPGRRHREIQPGIYPLRRHTPTWRVLTILQNGRPQVKKVVVRERMTLVELAQSVESTIGVAAEDLKAAAKAPELRARVGSRAQSIEGYLYPTDYYVDLEATAPEILRQMADTFAARWDPQWNSRLDSLGWSRDEAVTLASIIAGEMPHPDERLQVASVYHNRLARGMRLQADPTVIYALGQRRRLRYDDYEVESEYNTYARHGLPPGPIGQPSTASLEAALYPAETDFLYFVGRWDGRHEFSRTYREHLRTIRRLRGRAFASAPSSRRTGHNGAGAPPRRSR